MAEYADREKAYGATMAGQLKAFCEAVAQTDDHLKDMAMKRLEELLKAGNMTIEAVMTLLGIPQKMRFEASLPLLLVTRAGALLIKEATIKGHMDVSAHTEDSSSSHEEMGVDGTVKVGWGPVSASLKIHAQAGASQEHKRSSDYRASVDWEVTLEQAPATEAVHRIMDALVNAFDGVVDINKETMDEKAQEMRNAAKAKAAADDKDGGDGDDGDDASDADDGADEAGEDDAGGEADEGDSGDDEDDGFGTNG